MYSNNGNYALGSVTGVNNGGNGRYYSSSVLSSGGVQQHGSLSSGSSSTPSNGLILPGLHHGNTGGSSNHSNHSNHSSHSSRRHPLGGPGPPPSSSIQNTILSMNATKSAFSSNNLRTAELQKEKKAAAASRRQEIQQREAAKDDLFEAGPGLFDCPQKVVQADPMVNQVLGCYERTVNYASSCIGIDYQPQTPAPTQHIIGEEDEDPKPRRPPTLTRLNGSRLPENISQTHRPAARNSSSSSGPGGLPSQQQQAAAPLSSRAPSSMLPPPAPNRSKNNSLFNNHPNAFVQPLVPSERDSSSSQHSSSKRTGETSKQRPKPSSSSSSRSSNNNNAEYEESKKVQDMIRQMKDPICGFSNQMPALLPAIVTPLIPEHEGNNSRSVPKYFPTPTLSMTLGKLSASPPLHRGSSKSNLSEDSDSDKDDIEEIPVVQQREVVSPKPNSPLPKASNSDSNSTAESSSEDSSESEDEDDVVKGDSNEDEDEFSLANLAKKANLSKFSPSSSSSAFKDTHSPQKKAAAAAAAASSVVTSVQPPHLESTSGEKSPPEDEDIDFISGLLTTSTPDINLDFAGTSNLPIDRPISPMKQSPVHSEGEASPVRHTISKEVVRTSSRRRSASNTAIILDSSDEEAPKRVTRTKRTRANTVAIKKDEAISKKSKAASHHRSSKRALSSEDEDCQPQAVSKAPPSRLEPIKDSPPPVSAAPNKKKNMALGNIFGVKTSSSSKGGGKGKAGIKVEVIERQACENPPKPPRPRLLCRIPLRLLNHHPPPPSHTSRRHHSHHAGARSSNAATIENLYSRRNLFDDEDGGSVQTKGEDQLKVAPPSGPGKSAKRRSKTSSSSLSSESKRIKLEPSPSAEKVPSSSSCVSSKGSEPPYHLSEPSSSSSSNSSSSSKCMMPPPSKRTSSSSSSSAYLLEPKDETEDDNNSEEEHNFCMSEAKRLKDEADKERDREQQAMKYIQAVLYFILCGNITERGGDKHIALVMYNETLSFIRDVCRPFKNSEFGNFDNKLAALSLRCQSLLYLKMYKLTQNEYRECQKIIGEHIMKAASQQNSPNSNTPSPAGSDGSRSSGYTSSGEFNNAGGGRYAWITTPPTPSLPGGSSASNHLPPPPQCLTVPQNVMKKHFQYGIYLTQCHDLWEQADMYLHRGHCEEFIKRLDRMCGPLTLHSALKDLVKYIRTGLNFWSKEREEAAAAAALSSAANASSATSFSSSEQPNSNNGNSSAS